MPPHAAGISARDPADGSPGANDTKRRRNTLTQNLGAEGTSGEEIVDRLELCQLVIPRWLRTDLTIRLRDRGKQGNTK